MAGIIRNKTIPLTILILVIIFLFFNAIGYFFRDQVIADKARNILQNALRETGLRIVIGNIRWAGWDRIIGTDIRLIDRKNGKIPFRVKQVNLKFDLFSLIKNRQHLEASLHELELINPRLTLYHFKNGTWNIFEYFPKQKKNLKLQTLLTIKNGVVEFHDEIYGTYLLPKINGRANLLDYPLLSWDVTGVSDFNRNMKWISKGKCRIDQKSGVGEFVVDRLSIKKLASLVDKNGSYKIRSGLAALDLKFAWNREGVWLENGQTLISGALVSLPQMKSPFLVKQLDASFSAREVRIKKARLVYNQTIVKAAGTINTETTVVKIEASADQVNLEDVSYLIPELKKISIQGLANLRIGITGTINDPKIDGEVFLSNARLGFNDQQIERISGRMTIQHNNLKIERMEGSWNNSLLGVYGTIDNLFNPRFGLKVYGYGLNLQQISATKMNGMNLNISGESNFLGEITGTPNAPKIWGEVIFEQLTYDNVAVTNFKLKLEWEPSSESIRVLELHGDLWDGQLAAKGEVRINPSGVKWQMSGTASDLNLERTLFGADLGIKGKLSTELIFKGDWHKGNSFEPGSILGIFKGEKLTIKDALVDKAEGVFSWVNGDLNIDSIQAKIGEGVIYGHLTWDQTEILASVNAEDIKIGKFLPNRKKPVFDGIFNGNFEFRGPLEGVAGRINGVFSEVIWDSKPIGTITGSLDYIDQGLNISEVHITNDAGDFLVKGRIGWENQPSVSINVTSENTNLNGFLQWLPVEPSLKVAGNAQVNLEINGQLLNPRFQGEILLANPVLGPLHMEQGILKVAGDLHEISVTEFLLKNQDSQIRMTGNISKNKLDLNITGSALRLEIMELQYANKKLHGLVGFKGKLSGNPADPVLEATLSGSDFSYGTFNYQKVFAQLTWDSQMIEISEARFSRDESLMLASGKIFIDGPLRADLEIKAASFSLKEALVDLVKMPPQVEIAGKLFGSVKIAGRLDNPDVEITGYLSQGVVNSLPIEGEYELSYSNNKAMIRKIRLTQGTGALTASGVWENGKLLKIEARLQDFSLQVINPFIDPSYQLAGVANSDAQLEWSSFGITGNYNFAVNNLFLNEYGLGNMQLSGKFSNRGLFISQGLLGKKGNYLSGSGYIPWPSILLSQFKPPVKGGETSDDLDLSLNLKNMPAELMNLLIKNLGISNGSVDGALNVRGFLPEPKVYGEIECNDLKFNVNALQYSIEGFQATITLDGHNAIFKKAKGVYGKGKFSISGIVQLEGLKTSYLDLDLIGSRIYYKNSFFDGYGDANLTLAGPFKEPNLSGDLKIYDCRISTNGFKAEKNDGFTWSPTLSISIRAGRNVRYRQMGIADVEVNGLVRVQGTLKEPVMEGEAISDQGTLTLYGQTFMVNQGKAVFKYSQGFKPYIDIESALKTPKVEVILSIKGQIGTEDIHITLTSQPFIPQSDLFSMLNWSELRGDKPFTVNSAVTGNVSFLTDTIFGDVFYELRNALNLDYLYLEPNFKQNDLRINAGVYITKELFLSYGRSFLNIPKENWGLDYQLTSRLTLGGNFSLLDGNSWRLVYGYSF